MTERATGERPSVVARGAQERGEGSGGELNSGDTNSGEPLRVPSFASASSAGVLTANTLTADAVPETSIFGADGGGSNGARAESNATHTESTANSRVGLVALLASVVAIAWFLVVIARDVEAARFTRLELQAVRVDSGPGWVDPRWGPALEQALAELPELDADDPATVERVVQTLAALPFVAEVGETRVLWPDGVRVQLRWREPVACVRTGDGFALVSSEGVVLPGEWSAPPGRTYGYYPLIGAGEAARAELESGAWLQDERWLDGLSVARVLAKGLQPDDWIRLGRVVIDTRESRAASVEHPGVVLWFEGGRRAYFGRAPHLDEPGELPVARKCQSLSLALRKLDEGPEQLDWELVDLRWDQPELLPRGGLPDAAGVAR